MEKKCKTGYHYHPKHLKADANGCMKDDDMMGKRENFKGTFSIYNAVRNVGHYNNNNRNNDPKSYIGV